MKQLRHIGLLAQQGQPLVTTGQHAGQQITRRTNINIHVRNQARYRGMIISHGQGCLGRSFVVRPGIVRH